MAFTVAQRTQEFGVRLALGAQRSRVITLVLKEGNTLAVIGALIGLGGATWSVGRCNPPYRSWRDGWPCLGAVALVLVVAALLACLLPAWRASRVEPIEALRYD